MTVKHRLLLAPIAVLATCGLLAGCNGTIGTLEPAFSVASHGDGKDDAEGRRHIGQPYKVAGRWYHPKEDEDYDKTGMASWYGTKFHGKSTANGERFDKTALTAAHPTLPLPSFVRVTVVETGKSAVVRVNDRGPFGRGRIIDVSRAAADELGFRRAGHAKVRVEYLGPAPIGGNDRDTRMAAKMYPPSKDSKTTVMVDAELEMKNDKPSDVEVRLASAEPLTGNEQMPPGVSSRYAPRRPLPTADSAGSSLTAYASEPSSRASGALAAVNKMDEPAPEPKHLKAQPLPETATNVGEDRFAGAHDLFASASGSGISQVATSEAPAEAAPAAQ